MGNKLIRDRGQSAGRRGLCDSDRRAYKGLPQGGRASCADWRVADRLRGHGEACPHTGSTNKGAEASRPSTRQTSPRQKGPVQGADWVRERVPVPEGAPGQRQELRTAIMSWDSGPSCPKPRGLGCECEDLCRPSQGPKQLKCDLCCERDIHTGF